LRYLDQCLFTPVNREQILQVGLSLVKEWGFLLTLECSVLGKKSFENRTPSTHLAQIGHPLCSKSCDLADRKYGVDQPSRMVICSEGVLLRLTVGLLQSLSDHMPF
jgi:hypothetical protein